MKEFKITARPKKEGTMYCITYLYKGVKIAYSAGIGKNFSWNRNINANQFPEIASLFPVKP